MPYIRASTGWTCCDTGWIWPKWVPSGHVCSVPGWPECALLTLSAFTIHDMFSQTILRILNIWRLVMYTSWQGVLADGRCKVYATCKAHFLPTSIVGTWELWHKGLEWHRVWEITLDGVHIFPISKRSHLQRWLVLITFNTHRHKISSFMFKRHASLYTDSPRALRGRCRTCSI